MLHISGFQVTKCIFPYENLGLLFSNLCINVNVHLPTFFFFFTSVKNIAIYILVNVVAE